MAEIEQNVFTAKAFLDKGQLVGIPTETVYGLAANALDVEAVARIFEVKNRPSFDPLIVHTDSLDKMRAFVQEIPEILLLLFTKFTPGPLTVLLSKKSLVPDLVTAGLSSVAVRIPNHPLTLKLLSMLEYPLAAPSANPFGYISPTTAQHVNAQLGNKLEYILDGGPCVVGLESTIVGLEDSDLVVYRKGGLPIEEIEAVVGKLRVKDFSSSNPAAPGMLKSHYAPKKRVKLLTDKETPVLRDGAGILSFCKFRPDIPTENQFILSSQADLREAAQNLFAGLRHLDSLTTIDTIYCEIVPDQGLGRAINDRLRRAAAI